MQVQRGSHAIRCRRIGRSAGGGCMRESADLGKAPCLPAADGGGVVAGSSGVGGAACDIPGSQPAPAAVPGGRPRADGRAVARRLPLPGAAPLLTGGALFHAFTPVHPSFKSELSQTACRFGASGLPMLIWLAMATANRPASSFSLLVSSHDKPWKATYRITSQPFYSTGICI